MPIKPPTRRTAALAVSESDRSQLGAVVGRSDAAPLVIRIRFGPVPCRGPDAEFFRDDDLIRVLKQAPAASGIDDAHDISGDGGLGKRDGDSMP